MLQIESKALKAWYLDIALLVYIREIRLWFVLIVVFFYGLFFLFCLLVPFYASMPPSSYALFHMLNVWKFGGKFIERVKREQNKENISFKGY